MFIRALLTMLTADAIDRHQREKQHQRWQQQAPGPASIDEQLRRPEAVLAPMRPRRP